MKGRYMNMSLRDENVAMWQALRVTFTLRVFLFGP